MRVPVPIRYIVVGSVGYVVNLATFVTCIWLGVNEYAALAPAFVLNTLSNFALNRTWTFESTDESPHRQARRFSVVALVLLFTNYATFHAFFGVVGLPEVVAQTASILLGLPLGFVLNRRWTFASGSLSDA